ncbi:MAG: sensor histidine kinase [Lysobacteraceae bacterium]
MTARTHPVERIDDIHQNPWVGLVYLVFVYFPLLFWGQAPASSLWVSLAATAVFIPMHFLVVRSRPRRRTVLGLAMVALAYVVVPFNPGGHTFLLYGLATLAWTLRPWVCAGLGLALWTVMAAQMLWLYPLPAIALGTASLSAVLGTIIIASIVVERARMRRDAQLRLSQEEVRRLARLAERERIGRDLHDLLGHTLSVVALKSELAGRLVDSDPAAARRHIGEVEAVARRALTEVREAVSGMKAPELQAELAAARLALESAGVALHADVAAVRLAPEQQKALAMALREAVTNIIRHADAGRVEVRLHEEDGEAVLSIRDDGRGGAGESGNGIRGMRERIEALGGRLRLESPARAGTRVLLCLPGPGEATDAEVPA